MKTNVSNLLRSAVCLALALCLILGACPAAYAGELTDDELNAIISGGLTQDQINDLVNGGGLTPVLPDDSFFGSIDKDAYTPETLPVFPDQPVGGTVNVQFPFEPSLCKTVREIADDVLTQLDARNTNFTVYFWTNEADVSALVQKILDMAKTHNGREKLGDYLRFHIAATNVAMQSYEWDGKTYVKADFQMTYYTTAQQEQELEQKFNQVMASLNLSGKSDYEKVKAIYDYITSHVTYDHDHKNNENYYLQFSAYAALIQGTAVCQGYANLFYRMALAAGLDCRIVTGWGQNEKHGWNIVRVDGKYYNVDPTWDAGRSDYKYFLKSNKDFPEHTVNFEEHGQHFFSDYPISETNFDPAQATGVIDSGTCGKDASWKLTSDGTLTVSGTGDMQYYSNTSDIPWKPYQKDIKKVVIENGITGIADAAFSSCSELETVSIPDGVTRIGNSAFSGCKKLTSVVIPNSVTSLGERAFAECSSLAEITLSSELTHIDTNAFADCVGLQYVDIPSGVTTINGRAFDGCTSLVSITIPNTVTSIGGYAFSDCKALTSINLPDSVTSLGDSLLSGCTSLANVTLGKGITVVPNGMFANCAALTTIKLSDSITAIASQAFAKCTQLKSIQIHGNVKTIGNNAFEDCANLESVHLLKGVTTIGISAFSGCKKLDNVFIPDTVTSIGSHAFSYCDSLSKVVLPESVKTIEMSTFSKCGSLKYIEIPESVTHIQLYAFSGCTSLCEIVFRGEAPTITWYTFDGVTATAYYPADNDTWTADIMQDYGGDITWVPIGGAEEHIHTPIAAPSKMDATCTTDGSLLTITSCETCGEELDRELTVIPALGHDYVNGKCTRCREIDPDFVPDQTAPALPVEPETCDHLSVTVTSRQEPTCTQAGKTETVTTCQKCGEELKRDTVSLPALGHDFQDGECIRCGQTDHTHLPGQPEKVTLAEPTCTQDGSYVEVIRCTVCGQELRRSETPILIPMLGHTEAQPKEENRKEPTCVDPGSYDSVISCAVCGDELDRQTVTLPATGHTEGAAREENRIEATCQAPGSYDLVTRCTVCDAVLSRDTIQLTSPDHSWDEGKVTTEPTQVPHGEKTYTCTVCGETRVEKLEHVHSYTDNRIYPTCDKPGYTEHTCACGRRYEDDHVKALGHDYQEGICARCGGKDLAYRPPMAEPNRVAGKNRFDTAFVVADAMKKNLGIDKFDAVVVASGINFADALSGSYLAAVHQAPILLTFNTDEINDSVKAYIRENLTEGGRVYILGGTNAVPASFAKGLEDFDIRRLAGKSRFDTNLKILQEAGIGDEPVLVCTGLNFADSLSASATGLPILLVWDELSKDQEDFLSTLSGNKIYIIGGEGAVSNKLQNQLRYFSPVTRLGGKDRFETSTMIAREFFQDPTTAVLAYAWNFPDGLCGGPLATTMKAPLILTMAGYEKQAMAYARVNGIEDGIVLGGESLIPDSSVRTIFGK